MTFTLKVTNKGGTTVFAVHAQDVRFSKVFGATRIQDDPLWYYPAYYPLHRFVLHDFDALKIPYVLSPSAEKFVAQLDRYARRIENREMPDGFAFKTKPYDHQLEGLVHVVYNARAALFYACGLGKTKIVIDWQRAIGCYPLILCPKVVLRVWAKEAKLHGVEQEYRLIDGATIAKKREQLEDAKNYSGMVVSYDTARRYYEEIAKVVPYNAIVADESHSIKGPTSQRTQAALALGSRASRRIIMSGTPSLGDPRDMYSQFKFLTPSLMPEIFWRFKKTFCEMSPYNKHMVVGFKNLDVLQERVQPVTLYKDKEECLDLPERSVIDIMMDLTKKQKVAYNAIVRSNDYQDAVSYFLTQEGILTGAGLVDIPHAAARINKLLQVTCGFIYKSDEDVPCDGCEYLRDCVKNGIRPHTKLCQVDPTPQERIVDILKDNAKLTYLMEKLREVLAYPKHKVIIWGQYSTELDILDKALDGYWEQEQRGHAEGHEFYHVRVDGSTRNTASLVDQFNEDPNCRVYLSQVSTGVGITLNAATYMMYFSLPWHFGSYYQSLDRNYRVGQAKKVVVFRFLAHDTVDVSVAKALSVKASVAEVLANMTLCASCHQQQECYEQQIQPFDEGCVHQRSIRRPITKAETI